MDLVMMIVVYKCVVFLSVIEGFGKQGKRLPCSPQFCRGYCKKTVNLIRAWLLLVTGIPNSCRKSVVIGWPNWSSKPELLKIEIVGKSNEHNDSLKNEVLSLISFLFWGGLISIFDGWILWMV